MSDELSTLRDTLNGLARLLTKSAAEDRPAIMAMIKNTEQSIAGLRAKSLTPQQQARQKAVDKYLDLFRRQDHPIAAEVVAACETMVAPSSADLIFMITSVLMKRIAKLEADHVQHGHVAHSPKPNGKAPRSILGVQHKEDILQ